MSFIHHAIAKKMKEDKEGNKLVSKKNKKEQKCVKKIKLVLASIMLSPV